MKALLFAQLSTLLLLFAFVVSAAGWEKVEVNASPVRYEETITPSPKMRWLLAWYESLGFRMPQPDTTFVWSEYLEALDPDENTPKAFDLCVFVDVRSGGHEGGIVMQPDYRDGIILIKAPNVDSDGSIGDTDYQVKMDLVLTFWRPHKKITPPVTEDKSKAKI